jgi:hypothetical protein
VVAGDDSEIRIGFSNEIVEVSGINRKSRKGFCGCKLEIDINTRKLLLLEVLNLIRQHLNEPSLG